MKVKLTLLFVPSEHNIVGEIRASSLNSEFDVVLPHEMCRDDYIASVRCADLVVVDITDISKIAADVMSEAIEYGVPIILTMAKYNKNIIYNTPYELVTKIKEEIKKL